MEAASSKIKNSIFYFEYIPNMDILNSFVEIDLRSKYNTDYVMELYHGAYLTQYNTRLLVDSFESFMFEDRVCKDAIEFKELGNKDIAKCVDNIRKHTSILSPYWRVYNTGNICIYGFRYFENIAGYRKWLAATYKGKILGVICYRVHEEYVYISYIDIAEPYKRKGIATMLIKEFNRRLDGSLPLVLSGLSIEGKQARVDELFDRYITNCKVHKE